MLARKTAAALAVSAVLAAGMFAAHRYAPSFAGNAQAAQPPAAVAAPSPRAAALPDFATLVQQYGPAVVNITVSGTRKASLAEDSDGDEGPSAEDPFFQFFRGLPFRFPAPHGDVPVQGQGSGFIVSPDGIVLTNAHVVRDASEVTVKLTDRRELPAKVLGIDPASDVAVLRVSAKDLPSVKLGDPTRTRVGDWVVAIGSPFGFENSVTAGIVSAKGRSLPGETYVPFIQTDVAVNPGNSGGPLFNLAGEVIGINSQIYSRSGGYQGLSFAIPIDAVLRVKDQIVATGHARHARLGVTVQQVNQALADSFGLKSAQGALVSTVVPDSAAARAGLQPGDIVLTFDGRPIAAAADLSAMVGQALPGDKVKLGVWRKGQSSEIAATLGAAQPESGRTAKAASPDKGRLGLAVRPLTPEERREAKVAGGLLVEGVNGPAAHAGMQAGDIVLSADGKAVKSVEELRAATADRKSVALLVQRGEARLFVPLQAG